MPFLGTHKALRSGLIDLGSATTIAFVSNQLENNTYTSTLPAIMVAFVNSNCQTIGSQTGTFVLTLAVNPGSATVSGSTTVAGQGAVSFNVNLTGTNISGNGYKFRISANGFPGQLTSTFNLGTPLLSAVTIVIGTNAPAEVASNEFISPAMTINCVNSNGGIVASDTFTVHCTIGNNPTSGTLQIQSTNTFIAVDTINGSATFDNVRIDGSNVTATGFTLRFSSTSAPTVQLTSTAFAVGGAKARTMFITQHPANAAVDAVIQLTAFAFLNSQGNGGASSTSTFLIAFASNPNGATLNGTTSQSSDGTNCSFTDLSISKTGTYSFVISDQAGILGSIITNPFTIS